MFCLGFWPLSWVLKNMTLMSVFNNDAQKLNADVFRDQEMEKLPPTLQFLPPEKERERDTVLRMMCVEILLLLATSK